MHKNFHIHPIFYSIKSFLSGFMMDTVVVLCLHVVILLIILIILSAIGFEGGKREIAITSPIVWIAKKYDRRLSIICHGSGA